MHKVCVFCKKEFYVSPSKRGIFCSAICYRKDHQKSSRVVKCEECGESIRLPLYRLKAAKKYYCDVKCKNKRVKGECAKCGKEVYRKRSVAKRSKKFFCSKNCAKDLLFSKGNNAWNKGMKGQCAAGSEKGWFQKGRECETKQPIGTIVVRNSKVSGRIQQRQWIKIAEPNKWEEYARFVYKQFQGEIRKGCIIHHIDRNPMNDDIENLAMLTRAEHINEHRHELH